MSENHPPASEEQCQSVSGLAQVKAKRKIRYSYILLGVWIGVSIAWLIITLLQEGRFGRAKIAEVIVIASGYFITILGLFRSKRIPAGKKPLKFF